MLLFPDPLSVNNDSLPTGATLGLLTSPAKNVETGRGITTTGTVPGYAARSVVFSPDGQSFVSTSDSGAVSLWQTPGVAGIRHFEGHDGEVWSVRFGPDGKTIVTAGFDGTARLWDVATGEEIRRLEGHTAPVNAAVFTHDGQTIITASDDKTVRVWPGMEQLLDLAESLIQRDPPEFTPEERLRFGLGTE